MSATIRERQKECNTLVSLLTGTVGHTVTVELRNETKVTGKLVHVEPIAMNLSLSGVTFVGTDDVEVAFESFYVKGVNIRFVQIPDEIDMVKTIQSQLEQIQGKRTVAPQGKPKSLSKTERRQRQKEFLERKQRELMEKLGKTAPQAAKTD